jgi:hypothetical protein
LQVDDPAFDFQFKNQKSKIKTALARVAQSFFFHVVHPSILVFFLMTEVSAPSFVVICRSMTLRATNVGGVLRFVFWLFDKLVEVAHTKLLPLPPPQRMLLRAVGRLAAKMVIAKVPLEPYRVTALPQFRGF